MTNALAPIDPLDASPSSAPKDLIAQTFAAISRIDFQESTAEQMIEAIGFMEALKACTRDLSKMFEREAVAWLNFHGDLTIGDCRYYAGTVRDVKCNDTKATTEALLSAAGGALDALDECMVAQPFKTGATKTVLGAEVFAQHFTTTIRGDLKTGRPLRSLQKASLTFTKGQSNAEE